MHLPGPVGRAGLPAGRRGVHRRDARRASATGREADLALEVDRIYRGEVGSDTVDVASPTDSCGLKLVDDQSYLVFAVDGPPRPGLRGVLRHRPGQPGDVKAVEKALGPGERFQAPVPEPAAPTYTRVLESDPPTFTRVAAPGAAMAIVGLLGWFVVRRRT